MCLRFTKEVLAGETGKGMKEGQGRKEAKPDGLRQKPAKGGVSFLLDQGYLDPRQDGWTPTLLVPLVLHLGRWVWEEHVKF